MNAISIFDSLSQNSNDKNNAKLRLGDIKFRVLGDLDGAKEIYTNILKYSKHNNIKKNCTLRLVEIDIAKGDLLSATKRINDNMNKWVGQRMILELSKRNLLTKNSEVLILGLTYKANCPDLRNSQVANLINFLKMHNINTNVVDPLADIESAKNIYSINLNQKIPKNKKFACVLLAVSHSEFISMNLNFWKDLITNNGFFFDLCNSIPKQLNPIRI